MAPPIRAAHAERPGVSGEHEQRCRDFLREAVPALAGAHVVGRRICYYCDTFDGYFWIDSHPQLPGLVVAAGGSGHAFKFAPVLGSVVADAVEERENRWGRPFRWRDPKPQPNADHARAEVGASSGQGQSAHAPV